MKRIRPFDNSHCRKYYFILFVAMFPVHLLIFLSFYWKKVDKISDFTYIPIDYSPSLYYPDKFDEIPNPESVKKAANFSPFVKAEFVPDAAQEVIEDPVSYVNQPPERPLLPRNFHQDIKGVAELEISPGVFVLHNFSAIPSHRIFKFANHSLNVTTYDSGFMKEHFVWLPPFNWSLPNGLTEEQTRLYWKQPENHWHFDDCKMWSVNVVWEVKNGVAPLCQRSKCHNHNYTNHLNYCEWPRTVSKPEHGGKVFIFGDHYVNIFQHFFDNGIPFISSMAFATGYDLKDISVISGTCNQVSTSILKRFGFANTQNCQQPSKMVSAETLIMEPSIRVLHPYYFEWYRDMLNYSSLLIRKREKDPVESAKVRDKILVLPRSIMGGGGGNARIISNFGDLVAKLKEIHGQDKVIQPIKTNNLNQLVEYYSTVKAVVGPHGGAFYNALLAPEGIDIIEMIPMMNTGKYPGQQYWDKLIPFAHLAMHSFSVLNNQKFWRYITMDVPINYKIDINDFLEWSKQIPSLAYPGPVNITNSQKKGK